MKPEPVRIAILHSLTGTMSVSERPLVDAARMAIHEINESGGLPDGRQIEAIIRDCKSDPEVFQKEALETISKEGVDAVFGCWTSASRKAVKPVVEEMDNLLWYPVQYEGLEESPNIVYTGSCLNQQINPLIDWSFTKGLRRYFLVGSDYVFPRVTNGLATSLIAFSGGEVLGEAYAPLGSNRFSDLVDSILATKPDAIINSINGDSNFHFYRELFERGVSPEQIPVLAVSVSETETLLEPEIFAGHYSAWSYFSSDSSAENIALKERLARFVTEHPVYVSDPVVSSYAQIYIWRLAVEITGSTEPSLVRKNIDNLRWSGPGGEWIVRKNHHTLKHAIIGQALPDGNFLPVHTTRSPIEPEPWLGFAAKDRAESNFLRLVLASYPNILHTYGRQMEKTNELIQREMSARLEQSRLLGKMEVQESETRRIQKKLEALFDSMRDPAMIHIIAGENSGRIVEFNQALCGMLAMTAEELRGKGLSELIPAHASLTAEEITRTILDGRSVLFQADLLKANQQQFPAEFSSIILEAENGETLALSTIRDISERIQNEKEREERNALLIQQSKMAGIGSMVGAVAHQWKQPLSILSLRIADLEDALEAGELNRSYIQEFTRATEKLVQGMAQTIEDFRNFFVPGNKEDGFNPIAVVRGTVNMLFPKIKNKGIDVTIDPADSNGVRIQGNVNEFRQILLNLISNSIDAIEAKRAGKADGRIRIRCEKREENRLLCTISDNGGGFTAEIGEKIFSPFTTTKGSSGTGIGLYISRLIVEERLGGTIHAENTAEGASFSINLPINKSEE